MEVKKKTTNIINKSDVSLVLESWKKAQIFCEIFLKYFIIHLHFVFPVL